MIYISKIIDVIFLAMKDEDAKNRAEFFTIAKQYGNYWKLTNDDIELGLIEIRQWIDNLLDEPKE